MAKRTEVIMVDDLDGRELNGEGKTITFSHGGNAYEIDLSETNARRLEEALAPFVASARRVGGRRLATSTDKPDLHAMRTWAKAHGIKVSERGRVSQDVQNAYRSAQ
jgi:hypothetical protein